MSIDEKDLDPSELESFTKYFNDWKGVLPPSKASLIAIPRFYEKTPVEDESGTSNLQQKLREEARSLFLQKKSRELLDNVELKEIWNCLEQNHTPPVVDDDRMINYAGFKIVATKVSSKATQFFTPSVFGK